MMDLRDSITAAEDRPRPGAISSNAPAAVQEHSTSRSGRCTSDRLHPFPWSPRAARAAVTARGVRRGRPSPCGVPCGCPWCGGCTWGHVTGRLDTDR